MDREIAMAWSKETLETTDGAKLNCFLNIPDAPRAIVQINHGLAEHAARYRGFSEALALAGFGSVAHDHRGHGETTAPGASQGQFAKSEGWNAVIEDVGAVNRMITERYSGVPIICFGHSMGSIIAFNYILRNPTTVSAAALWNAGVETGMLGKVFSVILRTERFFKGSDVPSPLAKKATFETWNKQFAPTRTEFDWLSTLPAEVDKYMDDPLCGFEISISLWLDLLSGTNFAADDSNLDSLPENLPIHLLAGTEDPCTEGGKVVANIATRMEKRGMNRVTLEILEQTRHESLNEFNKEETSAKFISWLNNEVL